jgi:hypothetical protein
MRDEVGEHVAAGARLGRAAPTGRCNSILIVDDVAPGLGTERG